MNFDITQDAYDDLAAIEDWVGEHFGPLFVERTRRKLFSEFALLSKFPHMGVMKPDVTIKPMRFFCSSPYWIVYAVGPPVVIHRVFHAARDLARLER